MCNRLDIIPACDGQTDRQTDSLPRHSLRYEYVSGGKDSRVSVLTRDIDIAILSVCPSVRLSVRCVPVFYENDLTYRHSFFTIR